jgi:hypothetical protein
MSPPSSIIESNLATLHFYKVFVMQLSEVLGVGFVDLEEMSKGGPAFAHLVLPGFCRSETPGCFCKLKGYRTE